MSLSMPPFRAVTVAILLLGAATFSIRGADSGLATSAGNESPVVVPEPTPRAVHFHQTGLLLWCVRQIWVVLLPLTWVLSRAAARMGSRLPGRRHLQRVAAFATLYYLASILINLPWSVYLGLVRPTDYGLSTQTLGDFIADEVKSTALGLAFFVGVVTGLYTLIRYRPRTWWRWAALAVVPLMLVLTYVVPIYVDPLFHEYGPMSDRALESKIVALADRAGVAGSRVYEVDMSRETRAVNASVTGLLGTKRIVLWDTLLAKLADEEVLAVVGHEVGHYVLNHVLLGLAVTATLVALGLAGVAAAAGRLVPRWSQRYGISRLDDPTSLPILVLLAQLASFGLTPIGYAVSRHVESEADRFALELTQDNGAAARAFVALQRSNLGYPRPGMMHTLFRSTHPSLGERIDFCNSYHPWREGQPLRYAHLFRDQPDDQAPSRAAPFPEPR